MLKKILKRDLSRNKLIIAILFVFIMLAAMLTSSAISLILELLGSVNVLFEKSAAPHYVQMYSGELNQEAIDSFSEKIDIVSKQQTTTLLNINSAYIFLGNNEEAQTNSILENSFVVQNNSFDFLLDQNNEVMQVNKGEIGVPVYYMKQNHLETGDKITIRKGDFYLEFTIKDFIRDVQMNSSLVTSKRFLINENDMEMLEENIGEKEYLIEFLLTDISKINEFEALYQSSELTKSGTTITYSLYQLLNSLSDGIVAAVIILVTIMLMLIALVSLRFILLSTIAEDYQEIGNMKAIGISYKQIRSLYLVKYLFICGIACFCGYLLSIVSKDIFVQNIILYMGKAEQTSVQLLLPLSGAFLIFLLIICFCNIILRRFKKISVVESLQNIDFNTKKYRLYLLHLHKSKYLNINLFLGLNELFVKFKTYALLCFVFIICMFLIVVPLNFLNTLQSPTFITYMGAGESNIRIDINQTKNMYREYADIIETLKQDQDIEKYSSFVTSSYKIQNNDKEQENIKIENGNFDIFPLQYVSGNAPQNENQIALSVMNAEELDKQIGSTITVFSKDKEYLLEVCGIYQDITNGGKTAKAMLPYDSENVLWYVINLNIKNDLNISEKINEYTNRFPSVKITDMESYVSQTFGSVISSLDIIIKLSIVLSLAVSILITALFIKLLITNEKKQIASMLSIGFSVKNIRQQYMIRILSVLALGIIIGTILAGTIGSYIVGKLLTGISNLQFIVNPFNAYIMCPMLLLISVSIVIVISTKIVKKISIMTLENER